MVKFNKIQRLLREIIYIWDFNLLLFQSLRKEITKCMLNTDLLGNYLMPGKTDLNKPNNQEDPL